MIQDSISKEKVDSSKIKGEYHFPSETQTKSAIDLTVSSDKKTLVPTAPSTHNNHNEDEDLAKQVLEQRIQLEHQIQAQKQHSAQKRQDEENELQRLRAEMERLKHEEERHAIEARKKHEEAVAEVNRLKSQQDNISNLQQDVPTESKNDS